MHFINTILLVGAGAASLVSAATTTQYFTLNGLNSNTPSGITTPAYDSISIPISDSKTKTSTICQMKWNYAKKPSSSWTPCQDQTYSIKISNYKAMTDFNLAIQHQSTKAGKKCANVKAKTCITSLASTHITKSVAAFQTYCGASGACGAVSDKKMKVKVSSSKAGTQ